jgi:photoactive yellow protein
MTVLNGPTLSDAGSPHSKAGAGPSSLTFADITIEALDRADAVALDKLPFGVIGLDSAGLTRCYNRTESELAGLLRESIMGHSFFLYAVCMNNFLVAQRFEDEPTLDVTMDYVLTFRMRPTEVKLRLLQHPKAKLHYILIQR